MSEEEVMEKLIEDFGYYGIVLPPKQVLEKCVELCKNHGLSTEEFGEQWISFSMFNKLNKDGTTPTLHSLELFERKLVEQLEKTNEKRSKEVGRKSIQAQTQNKVDDILSVYSDSPSEKNGTPKRQREDSSDEPHTPKRQKESTSVTESNNDNNLQDHLKNTEEITKDEDKPVYSENYSNRKDALSVVESYGSKTLTDKSTFKTIGTDDKIIIQQHIGIQPDTRNKLYFDVKSWKYTGMNHTVEKIGHYLIEKHNLDTPVSIMDLPLAPEESVTYGRVRNTSSGKMKPNTVLLETSVQLSNAQTVSLDLVKVNQCSLFPGQIVAVNASKLKQDSINVSNIYSDATLNLPVDKPELNTSGALQMVVASGPFTLNTDLSYGPLIDLISYATEHNPHVLMLLGPFLDEQHENISEFLDPNKGQNLGTFKTHFEGLIKGIVKKLSDKLCTTQVIIVSSSKEAHHYSVYPTPAYSLKTSYPNVHFMPDPCVIDINGLRIGLTATDILFHLSKEELYLTKVSQNPNRITRIAQHIIKQQSFYPLYPSSKDVNLDYKLLKLYGYFNETPHIIVLPSNLRYFAKDIEGCFVVNPERLSKGYAGGTFARMEVYPNQSSQSAADNIICEILKI